MKHIRHVAAGWVLGLLTASGIATAASYDIVGRLQAAQEEAATIDRIAQGMRDTQARARIQESVGRLRGHLSALDRELRGPERGPRVPGPERGPRYDPRPPAPPVVVHAVDGRELDEMKRALKAATFSSDQLALLDDLRAGRVFTSDQVLQLVEVFSFSNDRVEAAARLHPHVVDPERFWIVIEAMPFSSDKEALRRRITP